MGITEQPDDPSTCPHCGGPESACQTISSHPYMAEIEKLLENMPDCVEKDAIAWAHGQIRRDAAAIFDHTRFALRAIEAIEGLMIVAPLVPTMYRTIARESLGVIDKLGAGTHAMLTDDYAAWLARETEDLPS